MRYQLSDDHQWFVEDYFDGDRTTTLSVRNLDNVASSNHDFAADGGADAILDFSGPELVVGTTGTQRWTPATGTLQPVGVNAAGADLQRDVLFATDPATGESGPTSIDAPSTPAWTAPMVQPVVSPGGGRVVSRNAERGKLLTVRNLATGAVDVSFSVRYLTSTPPVWETNRSLVFLAYVGGLGDRQALVRCRLSGVCQRVSPIIRTGAISLP